MRIRLFSLALTLAACGGGGDDADAGLGMDAAIADDGGARVDARPVEPDAGRTDDAGGSEEDAGSDDAGTRDAGSGGEACTPERACEGGLICAGGPSCGDAWTCVATGMACTDDAAPYCGCDGVTFTDSGTCPTRPFRHRGACDDGTTCDRSAVTCRAAEPVCPEGEVAEVEGTCWSFRCVPIDSCRCSGPDDCPMRDSYTCHMFRMRCGPYL